MAAVSADESLERYADWARERITNTPSLEQRLVALPDLLPDQGQQLLAGDQDQNILDLHRAAWAWATRKGRNDIAHRGITTALDSDAVYATILTTAAVVELVVLTELGFDDAHLANVTGRRFDDIPSRIQERLVPLYQQALATR